MPAIHERTSEPPVPVRELEDDEEFVMTQFEEHASRCSRCANPLQVHKEGGTLCDRGHQYAIDVAQYLYSLNGKAYSAVDRDLNQYIQVRIPHACKAVRGLLLAIENGLRLRRKENAEHPVISFDATYPVPPRLPTVRFQDEVQTAVIERAPREKKRRHTVVVYRYPRHSPTRGSLYESDFMDRIEREYEPRVVYLPAGHSRRGVR
ncbi:hypothetical protein M432DRAFT_640567 [Thermoascus aurantiacus ATCC 26904]